MSPEPLISVVIATKDRQQSLARCLESLERQRLDPLHFEVVVVNDGSSDATQEFLERFAATSGLQLSLLAHENRGVSASRNRGIAQARSAYIAFTDDDCVLPPEWLEIIIAGWRDCPADVAGIGGPLETVVDDANCRAGRFIRFLDEFKYVPVLGRWRVQPVHVDRLRGGEQVAYLRTSNASFRKSCLAEVGGFDQSFRRPGGEDPDLCYRLLARNHRLRFDPGLLVAHRSRDCFRSFFRTTANYVAGEIRKSRKCALYGHPSIRRNYMLLPLQKVLSFFLELALYPVSILRILRSGLYNFSDAFFFPLILAGSKLYALAVCLRLMLGVARQQR